MEDFKDSLYTGCDNITSFFIMRSNQAVEVIAGWACFNSTDEILVSLEIQSAIIMRWSSEERVFAVEYEAYFSNRLSVIATQRTFRNCFNVAPKDLVLDRKSIVTWVTTFRQTGSTTR